MKGMSAKQVLELVFRQCVFVILNLYGLSKLIGGQFYRKGELPVEVAETTLGEVSSFSLAWTFMGHSFPYILFVAVFQLLGAWLLLWNRTKLFGVFILIPIMVNIIVFDILFLDVYPALANAIFCLIMLLLILFFNKEKVLNALGVLAHFSPKPKVQLKRRIYVLGITVVTIGLIFAFDSLLEYWLGASKEKVLE